MPPSSPGAGPGDADPWAYAEAVDLRTLSAEVESVSAGYARRFAIDRSDSWFLLKLHEEMGELTQAYLRMTGQTRPDGDTAPADLAAGFRAELADVLCHVVLLARRHDVDLDAEIAAKWLVWKQPAQPLP